MSEIEILFEDQYLLAVQKPAGLSTQASYDRSRADLFSLLQKQRNEKLYLHHRLDRDTSGVLLLGRHPSANKGLTELFREHQIQKTYWALAKKHSQGEDRVELQVRNFLAPVRSGEGKKLQRMVEVKSGGWAAETDFVRLKVFAKGDLWEARPKTGRTHQIRVHLAGVRRPILGDNLYGGKSSEVPRLMLHARSLEFLHPVTNAALRIEAPLPSDFQTLLSKWETLS